MERERTLSDEIATLVIWTVRDGGWLHISSILILAAGLSSIVGFMGAVTLALGGQP